MKNVYRWAVFPVCLFLAVLVLFPAQSLPTPQSEPDARARLETVEDLTESLANDMLDLSLAVRDRDEEKLRTFIPASLSATAWPAKALALATEVKWVARHGWKMPAAGYASDNGGNGRAVSGEEFLRGWLGFLDHFSSLEDARFKVKDSSFDASADVVPGALVPTAKAGSTGQAQVSFFLIGRDAEGRREWVRGTAAIQVHRSEKRWQFQSFRLGEMESQVATSELFSEVALPAGVETSLPHYGSPGSNLNFYVWNGASAADFDNDGWVDLFVTGHQRTYLYLNKGDGSFREAAWEAGLGEIAGGVSPLSLDFDNDGDLDVFLTAVGPQRLLENRLMPDGRLVFQDVSAAAGVAREAIGISATAADINADGYPDIYVTGYNDMDAFPPNSFSRATNGTPNLLFINQRDGTFREEGERWGVADGRWSYAAQFADFNGDGRLDLYVANDLGENGFYIHQGDRFEDQAVQRGVLDPGFGMGVSFADYNNDGRLDLHVTNMSSSAGNRILSRDIASSNRKKDVLVKLAAGNSLYENTGDGHFKDVTAAAGPFPANWAWGGGFLDFDNDGWEDLYTPNGYVSGKLMKDT